MKNNFWRALCLFASTTLLPLTASAKVSINEVAWMGSDKSQYGEWVELYNDGADSVDLNGAGLYADGGKTLIIKLTKSIAPGGYYLIARTTPSLPDPGFPIVDDSGSFGGGGLSNSGEYLVLKSADGAILDSLDASSGWPAGDASTKQTMQLAPTGASGRGGWFTATGTPRAQNVVSAAAPRAAGADTASSSSVLPPAADNAPSDSSGDAVGLSAHSDPADLNSKIEELKIFASAGRDRLATVGAPVTFKEKLYNSNGDELGGGDISWSFGDGQGATGNIIVHAYQFPGDYAVVMNVLKNAENYVARANVKIVPAELQITDAAPDFVKIKNLSAYEANLGGWSLASGGKSFIFSPDTIILPKKEITIPKDVIGADWNPEEVKLLSVSKAVAATFSLKKNEASAVAVPAPTATSSPESNLAAILSSYEQKLLEARKILAEREPDLAANPPHVSEQTNQVLEKQIVATATAQAIPRPKSFLETVIALPVRGWDFIKKLF